MPEITNILRQRLGAEEAPKVHPDADTLTAFVEGLLPAAERGQVLLHISLCTSCRAVVALTMPDSGSLEPEQVAAAAALPAPRRAWFFGPRFALVMSLVAVAAGIFLVLRLPEKPNRKSPVMTAAVQPPPPPVAAEAPVTPSAATTDEGALSGASPQFAPSPELKASRASVPPARGSNHLAEAAAARAAAENQPAVRTRAVLSLPAGKAVMTAESEPMPLAPTQARDYLNNKLFAGQSLSADLASAPQVQEIPQPPQSVRPTFAFNAQPRQNSSGTIQSDALFSGASSQSQSQSTTVYEFSSSGHTVFGFTSRITQVGRDLHLKRIVPAISFGNANRYAMFSPALKESEPAEMAARKKAVGPALAQSSAFTSRAMAPSLSELKHGGNSFLWKVSQGRLLKSSDMTHWADAYPASEGIEFSVVTVAGADVWAGGKAAALVHSRDGGVTWERIILGASATAEINSIEVNNSTIQVRDSSGQGWLSQDGGRSWTLQN